MTDTIGRYWGCKVCDSDVVGPMVDGLFCSRTCYWWWWRTEETWKPSKFRHPIEDQEEA